MVEPARRYSRGKPDWLDILFAATLTSWATMVIPLLPFLLGGSILNFRLEFLVDAKAMINFASGMATLAIYSFFIAMVTCTVLGLPALGLAILLRLDAWWQGAAVGAVAGLIFAFVFTGGRTFDLNLGLLVAWLAVAGALAGIAAWRERRKRSQVVGEDNRTGAVC